jgi:hypothetical protein
MRGGGEMWADMKRVARRNADTFPASRDLEVAKVE